MITVLFSEGSYGTRGQLYHLRSLKIIEPWLQLFKDDPPAAAYIHDDCHSSPAEERESVQGLLHSA